jgi:hypothetical protein
MEKQISGALKSTIAAHGAITKDMVPSATKRIVGQLRTACLITKEPVENLKIDLIQVISDWESRLHRLREASRKHPLDRVLTQSKGKELAKCLKEIKKALHLGKS